MWDEEPPPKRRRVEQPVLTSWGQDELRAYIAELQAEILRAEAEIARKADHRSAADKFFRT